jgi:hypothetical protein
MDEFDLNTISDAELALIVDDVFSSSEDDALRNNNHNNVAC